MKTARELAREIVCNCITTANESGVHEERCDRRTVRATVAIEQDRREVIEACAKAATDAIDVQRRENETDLRSVKYMVEDLIITVALAHPKGTTPAPKEVTRG